LDIAILEQWFSKWVESSPLRKFREGGEQNEGVIRGQNNTMESIKVQNNTKGTKTLNYCH